MNGSRVVGRLGRFRLINTLFSADDQWSRAGDMSTNRWTDLFRPLCVHQARAPPLGRVWGIDRGKKIKRDEKGESRREEQVEIKGIKGGKTAGDYRGVWHVQMGGW